MVCLTLARCYREKFGGEHIDDVLRRGPELQAAHRLPRVSGREPPAIVFNRLHGAGKSTALAARARRGWRPTRSMT
jgi:hypothetical protein